MAIKSEQAYEYHFIGRPEELTLAKSLGEAFDVTYGDRFRELSFWFADPKEHACERFGLRDEVLVVYSAHSTVDGRVLRAIGQILADGRFAHRLDPVLVLLIHHGDAIRVNEFLYANEQDHVVVPFRTAELFDASRGDIFIRQRIAQYFGDKDLFGIGAHYRPSRTCPPRFALVYKVSFEKTTAA